VTKQAEINPEDARLVAAGFEPGAPAADAIAKLRELRNNPEISAAAVARALGNIPDAAAAAMLAEMETEASGALRREIRRALFKLHQRGIEPPARPSAPASAAIRPAAEPSNLHAFFTAYDSDGARIVWIIKPRPQGGIAQLWGVVSEDEGLVGMVGGTISRRELRDNREEMERRGGMKLVEGDWRLADFLLCDAYRRTPEARRARVGSFMAMRTELIASPPPAPIEHPIYTELAAEASAEPSLDLLKQPEIAEWKLRSELLAPIIEELNRANESTIVLNPMQQQERVAQILERAADSLLAGELGMRIRRRLEETAYYMLKTGRRQEAGWAAGAAARIRDGADLKHSPFFQAFIRAQVGSVVAEEQERAREEPRLIMTPAEAMRAREAARHRHR